MLIGGLRVLNTNFGGTKFGVFTDRPETLTNDFFVNLLDMKYVWKATSDSQDTFEGRERKSGTGEVEGDARRPDLRLQRAARAVSEVYACSDSQPKFVKDFVSAWHKVMNLDRFDIIQTV